MLHKWTPFFKASEFSHCRAESIGRRGQTKTTIWAHHYKKKPLIPFPLDSVSQCTLGGVPSLSRPPILTFCPSSFFPFLFLPPPLSLSPSLFLTLLHCMSHWTGSLLFLPGCPDREKCILHLLCQMEGDLHTALPHLFKQISLASILPKHLLAGGDWMS